MAAFAVFLLSLLYTSGFQQKVSSLATLVVPIGIGAVFISTTATEVLLQASATDGQRQMQDT